MSYYPRCVDAVFPSMLRAFGGVLVQGPRACGKTETSLQFATSEVRLDASAELVRLALDHPDVLLEGDVPRLVDEWQLAPSLWNAARHEIDRRKAKGQFIFSGSATPASDVTRHTGAARFGRLRMRTMSLAESGHSSRQVSLRELLAGHAEVHGESAVDYMEMARQAVIGGWPGLLGLTEAEAQLVNRSYLSDLAEIELPLEVGRRFNSQRIGRLLQSLGRNISGELNVAGLARDVSPGEGAPASKTVGEDLNALQRVFAFDPLPAWSVELRSRARLRTRPKIQLADPSLALAALRTGSGRLATQPSYFGQVFESMVVRDVRAYASTMDGDVYHFRDSNGVEVDAIVDTGMGWGAAEVKLGASQFDRAEANLLKFRATVNTDRIGEPAFLAIISATQYAYTLPSGVHVIPLAAMTW